MTATLALLTWLAGCQASPVGTDHSISPAPTQTASAPQAPTPAAAAPATPLAMDEAPAPPASPVDLPASTDDLLARSLAYAERLRQMPPADITAAIAALGDPGSSVQRQMQLALLLMHAPPPNDTSRTLGLLQRVISHPSDEATALKPLARLLATRLATQRKLEESNERLNLQWREAQRRIELLNDQLDAMRAIERSLSPKPATTPAR